MASASPLLTETLTLLKDHSVVPGPLSQPGKITSHDALLVIDMQYDFLPGGAFGVAEGDQTVTPIAKLMTQFHSVGATVIASRDYHPDDHCSFTTNGGPFPPHCVQGSKGAEFHPEIAAALEAGKKTEQQQQPAGKSVASCSKTHVVYKGFSKDIDSFGALSYTEKDVTEGDRLTANKGGQHCASCWTGAFILKCSSGADSANAPPDVMAILDKKTIDTVLGDPKQRLAAGGRIFVVGLALDFCVHDTAINAVKAGYQNVSILVDCARSAHIGGVGKFGTGFLSDPALVAAQLKDNGILLTTSDQLRFE